MKLSNLSYILVGRVAPICPLLYLNFSYIVLSYIDTPTVIKSVYCGASPVRCCTCVTWRFWVVHEYGDTHNLLYIHGTEYIVIGEMRGIKLKCWLVLPAYILGVATVRLASIFICVCQSSYPSCWWVSLDNQIRPFPRCCHKYFPGNSSLFRRLSCLPPLIYAEGTTTQMPIQITDTSPHVGWTRLDTDHTSHFTGRWSDPYIVFCPYIFPTSEPYIVVRSAHVSTLVIRTVPIGSTCLPQAIRAPCFIHTYFYSMNRTPMDQ